MKSYFILWFVQVIQAWYCHLLEIMSTWKTRAQLQHKYLPFSLFFIAEFTPGIINIWKKKSLFLYLFLCVSSTKFTPRRMVFFFMETSAKTVVDVNDALHEIGKLLLLAHFNFTSKIFGFYL